MEIKSRDLETIQELDVTDDLVQRLKQTYPNKNIVQVNSPVFVSGNKTFAAKSAKALLSLDTYPDEEELKEVVLQMLVPQLDEFSDIYVLSAVVDFVTFDSSDIKFGIIFRGFYE